MSIVKSVFLALLGLTFGAPAYSQSIPYKFDSGASTNSNLVVPGAAQVKLIVPLNTTTTVYYLKLYDKVTAPNCNTDPVKFKVPVPFGASNAGGGAVIPIPDGGLQFFSGVGFCLTGGVADNDNSVAAAGVTINFGVKQ